jgi:A/G-specific adenine glycosylase
MDLGATICTPKNPACALCPLCAPCLARARGEQEVFPIKPAKAKGKLRRGAAFVAVRPDGAVLVRTRAPSGLLGGMTEVPTSEWAPDFDADSALGSAPFFSRVSGDRDIWRRLPGTVNHVFTHFPLELVIYRADVAAATAPPENTRWTAAQELAGEAFPTVMRKVLAHALGPSSMRPKHSRRRNFHIEAEGLTIAGRTQ